MGQPLLLQAFEGTNKTVPVWFMRQAGRCLKEYRALKEKHSLREMFTIPELAAEITCMPVGILGVDAAILFADILTLPIHMGFKIAFDDRKGPVLNTSLEELCDLSHVHDFADIDYLAETIQSANERLPQEIPLIGFAGSPFTVATYLIEGGSSASFSKTFNFMHGYADKFHCLMDVLTQNTVEYLRFQQRAGVKVFQLFDSWGGVLSPADYAHFVLPYVQRIFQHVDLPSIYYVKGCRHLLALMDQSHADFLSVCHEVVLGHHHIIEKTKKGIQGNLFNGLLYADDAVLFREVNDVLAGGEKHGKYIFNLSHGVFPDVDPDKLKRVVDQVHAFRRSS